MHQKILESYPLILAGENEMVKVLRISGGRILQERLISIGIQTGDMLWVVHKQPGGSLLVEKNGCRFVLGGGMAHKIHVNRC